MRIVLMAALVLLLLVGHGSNAQADGGYTPIQAETIRLWYVYSEYYGLRAVDVDLGLRILRRESQYGLGILGDCHTDHCDSVGPAQLNEHGVYLSTPYYREYGLAGRFILEVNIASMAWAFNHGMISHWRPELHDRHWFDVVPSDPRGK